MLRRKNWMLTMPEVDCKVAYDEDNLMGRFALLSALERTMGIPIIFTIDNEYPNAGEGDIALTFDGLPYYALYDDTENAVDPLEFEYETRPTEFIRVDNPQMAPSERQNRIALVVPLRSMTPSIQIGDAFQKDLDNIESAFVLHGKTTER